MIFDIGAVIFVVVFSLVMMKKGGMRAILSLTGFVLSIIVAFMMYPVLSDTVYSTPLPENLEAIVTNAITVNGAADGFEALDAMPDFVRNAINIASEEVDIVNSISKSVTKLIIDVIVFILLIIVTKLAIKLLSGALNLTMKLPVLSQLNSLVGLCCGVAISLVIVWLAVALAGVLAVSNEQVALWIEGSKAVEMMSNITPF